MSFPTVTDIVATTIESRSRQIADNVTNNNAGLAYIKDKGNVKTISGGSEILEELSLRGEQQRRLLFRLRPAAGGRAGRHQRRALHAAAGRRADRDERARRFAELRPRADDRPARRAHQRRRVHDGEHPVVRLLRRRHQCRRQGDHRHRRRGAQRGRHRPRRDLHLRRHRPRHVGVLAAVLQPDGRGRNAGHASKAR